MDYVTMRDLRRAMDEVSQIWGELVKAGFVPPVYVERFDKVLASVEKRKTGPKKGGEGM